MNPHLCFDNPEHGPYGVAIREALNSSGIRKKVETRVVYGENGSEALQFAEIGNIGAAIVALSLVASKKTGVWSVANERMHKPIEQTRMACRRGKRFDYGQAFASFTNSPSGRKVLRRHGFLLPGERTHTP